MPAHSHTLTHKRTRLPLATAHTNTNTPTIQRPDADEQPSQKNTPAPCTLLPTQHPLDSIGLQIIQYATLSTPDLRLVKQRLNLVKHISDIIQGSKIGRREYRQQPYTLEVFGSISFGLDSPDSDLDICILDPERPQGLLEGEEGSLKSLPKVYAVKKLAQVFYQAQFRDIKPIPLAKTPIVKLRSPTGRFSIDLNCNNRLGCRNSALLRAYHDLSPLVFRALGMAVKQWAKARGFCDPSGRNGPISASSYTLILLLIAYLQAINHLPNLQDPEYIQHLCGHPCPDLIRIIKTPVQPAKPLKPPAPRPSPSLQAINTSFVPAPPAPFHWTQAHSADRIGDPAGLNRLVAQLLLGFFAFYDAFDFRSYIVSIRDGRPLRRPSGPPSADEPGMAGLLAGLKADLCAKARYPSQPSEDEDEDEITYVPFVRREGVAEHVQRLHDAQALASPPPSPPRAPNTAGNIKPAVLDLIRTEFARARRLLEAGGSLDALFGLS
ncbi:hypothetical protein PTTG_28780 [Puccinia triticina 1-1 BBBD Race 1]|uniref:polynucleotide adenylyltransferase n=1 Tax=Puccinia triticina (isolate 1-1 / race 1 (BBBD)) TaxID=630390 RepID=A0A180G9I3_PUCT1|nr:hypothetical protein PTTG_28780 [Puccinia triticina 1-1 BBBD Race 1]